MLLRDLSEEYLFDCECKKYSEKTIKNYRMSMEYLLTYIEKEFNVTELKDFKAIHIKHFIKYFHSLKRTEVYVNNLLKVYKTFCKYLLEEGYTDSLITDRVKNLKEKKSVINTFTSNEIKSMLNYYNGFDYISIRNKTIIAMLFDTGIRANELMTLKNSQIHHDYILILGKGNKERIVSKSPYLNKMLFKYNNVREG